MMLNFDDVVWDRGRGGLPVAIGRGASGIVYAGMLHGQPVAIKSEVLRAGEEEAWMKTVRLHMRATSPHIVAMRGIIVNREGDMVTHYIVMERLAGTMAARLLMPGGAHYGADVALRLKLLSDVAGGLAYLHSGSVIHAGVKPENVLLSASTPPVAKVADFGSSVLRREGSKTRDTLMGERGSLVYMDPRLFDAAASIATASDVYSFGVMAWQVLCGRVPYEAEMMATLPPSATGLQMAEALRRHVVGGGRPAVAALVERGVPQEVVSLVELCWAPAQGSRPAMAEVHRALEAKVAAAAGTAGAASAKLGAVGDSGVGVGHVPGAAPAPAHAPPTGWPPALHAVPVVLPVHANTPVAAPAAALDTAPALAPVESAPLVYEWDDNVVFGGQHHDCVLSLTLLPGCRLASGYESGRVRLWDAVRGGDEATAVLEGHGGGVCALAALPDGRRLAAGVSTGTVGAIVVWDTGVVPSARCATIDCDSGVRALAMLRNGFLAAGCNDGTVRLVEAAGAGASDVVATLKGHTLAVTVLAALLDGTLASGSAGRTVRLWDVDARACVATLVGHTDSISALAALADGRLASGSDDWSVRLWDVAARACVGVLDGHTHCVCALAALPDGRLVSGSFDTTIRVWDTRPVAAAAGGGTGAAAAAGRLPVVVLEGHTGSVNVLQTLPGGRLASGSFDSAVRGLVRLWRLPPPS